MANKNILIIDDESSVIYSIKKTLKPFDYHIITANNGREGLELVRSAPQPDLIILDLMMPEMNGIDFLKALALKPADPYAVIVLTGHGNDEEMRQCYALGAHFFVRKPFGVTDLVCLVERCLTFKELERDSLAYRAYLEQSIQTQNRYISKLSMALDHSGTSIIMTDEQGRITYVNRSYVDNTGFSLTDLQGKPFLSCYAMDNTLLCNDIQQHLETNNCWKGELQALHKDHSTNWVRASITPIQNTVGKATNFLLIQDDITVQKEAELEKLRSLEIAEQLLVNKQNFSNNMSHELMTPLHIITTATSIFDSHNTNASFAKYIGFINRASDNLLSRLTMVLNLKRLDCGVITPHQHSFSIKSLIDNVTKIYSSTATAKHLELSTYLADSLPGCWTGDELVITQILSYLVDNAIKFTSSGGQITIGVKVADTDKTLTIEVSDTGIGIAESQLEAIFDSFYQADGSSSRSYNGLGIGLSLAKKLAETLNGDVTVKSAEGTGSVFTLSLPIPGPPNF